MSIRTLGALVGLMGLLTLAPGCGDDRRTGPRSDGGTADSGTRPPLPPIPPGGVSVSVDHVSWDSEGEGEARLQVAVRVGSAADGTPAPLVWSAFSLETSIGAVLTADSFNRDMCPEGVAVAPGAVLPCGVTFTVPAGQSPVRVLYTADGSRTARAPISACSPSAPTGLCNPGQVCQSGTCQTQCSSAAPEGFCPGAGERCQSGSCRAPCSATAPSGYCDEGSCVDGACDTSCQTIDSMAEGCLSCASEVVEICTLTSPACFDESACTNCVIFENSTCGCELACEGCFSEAVAGVACVLDECPVCN